MDDEKTETQEDTGNGEGVCREKPGHHHTAVFCSTFRKALLAIIKHNPSQDALTLAYTV